MKTPEFHNMDEEGTLFRLPKTFNPLRTFFLQLRMNWRKTSVLYLADAWFPRPNSYGIFWKSMYHEYEKHYCG